MSNVFAVRCFNTSVKHKKTVSLGLLSADIGDPTLTTRQLREARPFRNATSSPCKRSGAINSGC
eukprot:9173560-Alexandrium_andersonii.AAC.1